MGKLALISAFVIGLGACGAGTYRQNMRDNFQSSGMPKATFDLNCPEADLTVTQLTDESMGVRGCEKQARYEFVYGAGWVMDAGTTVEPVAGQPATAPAPQ